MFLCFFLNSGYIFLLKNIYNIYWLGPKNHWIMLICELILSLFGTRNLGRKTFDRVFSCWDRAHDYDIRTNRQNGWSIYTTFIYHLLLKHCRYIRWKDNFPQDVKTPQYDFTGIGHHGLKRGFSCPARWVRLAAGRVKTAEWTRWHRRRSRILGKIIKILATRCLILGLKCTKNRFRLGLCPRPRWGSLQRSPDPLAGFRGPTSKGMGGEGWGGKVRRGATPDPLAGFGGPTSKGIGGEGRWGEGRAEVGRGREEKGRREERERGGRLLFQTF